MSSFQGSLSDSQNATIDIPREKPEEFPQVATISLLTSDSSNAVPTSQHSGTPPVSTAALHQSAQRYSTIQHSGTPPVSTAVLQQSAQRHSSSQHSGTPPVSTAALQQSTQRHSSSQHSGTPAVNTAALHQSTQRHTAVRLKGCEDRGSARSPLSELGTERRTAGTRRWIGKRFLYFQHTRHTTPV